MMDEELQSKLVQRTNPYLLKLDWKAYFHAFCELHGRFPVTYKGRLLFPDGWMYSATSYEGPEWPPEEGRAYDTAMRAYWFVRRKSVKSELFDLRDARQSYRQLIDMKAPVPLFQELVIKDPATGKQRRISKQLDMEHLDGRIGWLEKDLELCEKELEKHERRADGCVEELGEAPTVLQQQR